MNETIKRHFKTQTINITAPNFNVEFKNTVEVSHQSSIDALSTSLSPDKRLKNETEELPLVTDTRSWSPTLKAT